MILADTSAWVEYDRASGSPADERMAELIAADAPLAVTEPGNTLLAHELVGKLCLGVDPDAGPRWG